MQYEVFKSVAERYRGIDDALRSGRLNLPWAAGSYSFIRKDGNLGIAHLDSTLPETAKISTGGKTGRIVFRVTAYEEDRDGDVVVPRGRYGNNYQKNPTWFFGHQQRPIPIGTSRIPGTRNDIDIQVNENDILQACYFDLPDPDAHFLYGKCERGMINSTSIAFVPIKAYRRDAREKAQTHGGRPLLPPGWFFELWDHTETSLVGVGANAEAVRQWLSEDKSYISPLLYDELDHYAAQAKGMWSGWAPSCPPGFCEKNGLCVPLEGVLNGNGEVLRSSGENLVQDSTRGIGGVGGESGTGIDSDVRYRETRKAHSEAPAKEDGVREEVREKLWEIIVNGKSWVTIPAFSKEAAEQEAQYQLKDQQPKPRIEVKGPFELPPKERWNKSLSGIFDGDGDLKAESSPGVSTSTIYRMASKFLNCEIKDLYQNSTLIPSPRMGSFLTGLKHVLSSYRCLEVRNLKSQDFKEKDLEIPPVYETLQLNSKNRDSFLVQGMGFYEGLIPVKRSQPLVVHKGSGPHNNYGAGRTTGEKFVVQFSPCWNGLAVKVYTHTDDAALNQQILDSSWSWAKEHNFLKGEAFALSGEFLPRTEEKWDDVFLEDRNKKAIQRTLDLFNTKQLDFANRGVILTGPPGTGKTLSSRIFRNEAKGTFIWISSKDFHASGSVGGISMAFEMAKELAPTILCMEDVDNWLSPTSVDLLKTEMDGISRSKGVLTILTTNFPERLPDALIDRPGRFHDVLNFDLPNDTARKDMLSKWLPGVSGKRITEAVSKTKGYSGAHVYELANFAKSLSEHDGLEPEKALEQAISKVAEQRDLITKLQLEGSNYNPLRRNSGMYSRADYGDYDSEKSAPKSISKGLNIEEAIETKPCTCHDCQEGKKCPCSGVTKIGPDQSMDTGGALDTSGRGKPETYGDDRTMTNAHGRPIGDDKNEDELEDVAEPKTIKRKRIVRQVAKLTPSKRTREQIASTARSKRDQLIAILDSMGLNEGKIHRALIGLMSGRFPWELEGLDREQEIRLSEVLSKSLRSTQKDHKPGDDVMFHDTPHSMRHGKVISIEGDIIIVQDDTGRTYRLRASNVKHLSKNLQGGTQADIETPNRPFTSPGREEENKTRKRIVKVNRYDPVLNPIQVGDKVIAREMLLADDGSVLANSGDKLVVMDKDGPLYIVWRNGKRGKQPITRLRKSLMTKGIVAGNDLLDAYMSVNSRHENYWQVLDKLARKYGEQNRQAIAQELQRAGVHIPSSREPQVADENQAVTKRKRIVRR